MTMMMMIMIKKQMMQQMMHRKSTCMGLRISESSSGHGRSGLV
jgi:hypothetical protein